MPKYDVSLNFSARVTYTVEVDDESSHWHRDAYRKAKRIYQGAIDKGWKGPDLVERHYAITDPG